LGASAAAGVVDLVAVVVYEFAETDSPLNTLSAIR
jgi:hypothetical protein